MKKEYKTQPKLCSNRLTKKQRSKVSEIISKFKVTDEDGNTCGNVVVNFKNNKARICERTVDDSQTRSWEQIPSALALYRTIALFKCGVDGKKVAHYKHNWYVSLVHEETGEILGLGE